MHTTTRQVAEQVIEELVPATGSLIGDRWLTSGRDGFAVEDPATTDTLVEVTGATVTDAQEAADAAAAALPAWSARAPRERAEALRRAYDLMVARTDDFATLMVLENGKSLADARAEVAYAAEFFRWYGEEAVRNDGQLSVAPAGGARTFVQRRPVGVSVLVTPWNFPAAMMTRKVAPALAAGCTVVVKPASQTPLTALALGGLLLEAGVPTGVVNVVTSDQAGESVGALLAHPAVRKLSFTGSTRVGSLLLEQAAERVLNCSMELGGNAPFVVTASADLELAVEAAMVAKFRNGGQACTAANRFHVHRSVHDEFVERFAARIEALEVGPGIDGAAIGPMISADAAKNLTELVDAAVADGAEVAARAKVPDGRGHFVAPVLLTGVAPDADLVQHELFGPVAPVVVFDDVEEAIAQANSTEMGLSSYICSGDLQEAMRMAEQFEIGMVGINRGIVSDPAAPFGGTRTSGLGREGGHEGLEAFTETQYLTVDWR
ncbi:NAD-dependent succinate-semialdehyde dehydrogenase [Nocardioides daphniae]|uniref:NAD-dependent succinate-semialdehyde dehydrogenase n=1 Tax=Nocardioides daphniae TaxID=402297 RepID=A0ABQ1QN17_9ACTN|nr:NAD-dependent succinate-semialdehyde dehydrogenase [Nocardioides daphniae]GGD30747.1 NAD-dependent succinate-semialdehyde dehydrogenase [Nocardioides daphniae]